MSNNIVPSLVNLSIVFSKAWFPWQYEVGLEYVHKAESNHWDISCLPGELNYHTRRKLCRFVHWGHSTIPIRYLCWTDITCRELRFFLDNHHVESRACRNRRIESETITWDTEDQSSNITPCFAWLSHSRSQCSSVPYKTKYAEKPTESDKDPISYRCIEDQQSNYSILVLILSSFNVSWLGRR